MPRFDDGSDEQTEVSKQQKVVEHLIEITYYDPSVGGTVKERITTAVQDIPTSGYSNVPDATWNAIGLPGDKEAFSIKPIKETSDLRAQSVQLKLDGVDRTFIDFLNTHHFRGQPVKIWRVWFDDSAGTINQIVQIWDGLQNDPYTIRENDPAEDTDTPPTATVQTQSVSNVARMQRARPVMSNEDSHNNFLDRIEESTGDTGFQNVPKIQEKALFWGREQPQDDTQSGGGGGGRGHDGRDDRPGAPTPILPSPRG